MRFINEKNIGKIIRYVLENYSGNILMCVDIQPSYENFFSFDKYEFGQLLNNNNYNQIIYLYNGPDLGMEGEDEIISWLYNECEVEEDVIDKIIFFEKGYAFFRYLMDNYVDETSIVSIIQFMIKNGFVDSRDLSEEDWNEYVTQNKNVQSEEVREYLENNEDAIFIPDLIDFLKKYNNISICGGGKDECLYEVEIALEALGKKYKEINEFIY